MVARGNQNATMNHDDESVQDQDRGCHDDGGGVEAPPVPIPLDGERDSCPRGVDTAGLREGSQDRGVGVLRVFDAAVAEVLVFAPGAVAYHGPCGEAAEGTLGAPALVADGDGVHVVGRRIADAELAADAGEAVGDDFG